MKILNHTDPPAHIFDNEIAKGVTGRVLIGKADNANTFCMRSFTLAPGGFTPRHAHPWEHEIFIHSGRGQVYREGEWQSVVSGTAIFIPGDEEHQLRNGGDEDFVFICLIPAGVDEI
ncbi:MAG: cupin domain-containing protein [Desulfopila sp.]